MKIKISLAFTLVVSLWISVVAITFVQINSVSFYPNRIIYLRLPTVLNTAEMTNGINHSLAALRGWMLLGKSKFENERQIAWSKEINLSRDRMAQYSRMWTNPKNVDRFKEIKILLVKFEKAQADIMTILKTPQDINNPEKMKAAKRLMGTTAAPIAFKIKEILVAMEKNQKALADRDTHAAKREKTTLINELMILSIIAVLFSIIIAIYLIRVITRALSKAVDVANK